MNKLALIWGCGMIGGGLVILVSHIGFLPVLIWMILGSVLVTKGFFGAD